MTDYPYRALRPEVHFPSLENLPPLREVILDNGVPLKVYDRPELELIGISAINCGGIAEAIDPQTAIVAAEMRGYGSESMTGEEIADKLELNGAFVKSASSAHYTISNILTLSGKAGSVFPLTAQAILYPVFPEHETAIVAARKAEECEIMQTTEMFKASARAKELVCGKNHILGYTPLADDFRSVKRDNIVSFFQATQRPANLCLFAYGNMTPAIEDEINKVYGSVPSLYPGLNLNIQSFEPIAHGCSEHIHVADSAQSAIVVSIPAIPRSNPDYLALRLAVMALGGYFGSRLQQNIREDKGLTYGISAGLYGQPEGTVATIKTSCDASYVDRVREEIFREIARLSTDPLTTEELNRLKLAEVGTLLDVTDSPESIVGFHTTIYTQNLPTDYFEKRIEAARTIDAETIIRVSALYLLPEKAITVSAGR
ncbi:MAG: insulinase family protein [Paramuribaculum sp.]|nr:insulinase family protein [Paramuribaculum sp.]